MKKEFLQCVVSVGHIRFAVGAYIIVNYIVMFLMRASTRRDDREEEKKNLTIMMQKKIITIKTRVQGKKTWPNASESAK